MKKRFDCVEMKRRGQDLLRERLAEMSLREQAAFWAEESRRFASCSSDWFRSGSVRLEEHAPVRMRCDLHINVRPRRTEDQPFIRRILREHWLSPVIWSRGRQYPADALSAFVAKCGEERVGLVTYSIENGECEVVSLNSERERVGVGSALLEACDGGSEWTAQWLQPADVRSAERPAAPPLYPEGFNGYL